MNWSRYLEIKQDPNFAKKYFLPENQTEAKQALALGVIDISQYIEFSLTTEPLLDIVHDPDPNIRKTAIRQIAQKNTHFSIKLLHNMLNDYDEEVRLYAASEIDQLENEQQKNIHKLRQCLSKDPENSEIKYNLAKIYIEYAQMLLINEKLRSFFLKAAIELLDQTLTESHNNKNYFYYRGIAYQYLEKYQQAISDLKQAIKYDNKFSKAFISLAEIFYKQNKFDMLKQILKVVQIQKYDIMEENAQLFWTTAK